MGLVAHGMWDLPRLETEPVSPVWAGRFLTTGLPGKSSSYCNVLKEKWTVTSYLRIFSQLYAVIGKSEVTELTRQVKVSDVVTGEPDLGH